MKRSVKYVLIGFMLSLAVAVGVVWFFQPRGWSDEFRAAYVERMALNFKFQGMPDESAARVARCVADTVSPRVSQKRMETLRNTDAEPTKAEMELGNSAMKTCVCTELGHLGIVAQFCEAD